MRPTCQQAVTRIPRPRRPRTELSVPPSTRRGVTGGPRRIAGRPVRTPTSESGGSLRLARSGGLARSGAAQAAPKRRRLRWARMPAVLRLRDERDRTGVRVLEHTRLPGSRFSRPDHVRQSEFVAAGRAATRTVLGRPKNSAVRAATVHRESGSCSKGWALPPFSNGKSAWWRKRLTAGRTRGSWARVTSDSVAQPDRAAAF